MTRDEILKMEAGKEIDTLVALEIMGWKEHRQIPCPDGIEGCLVYHAEGDYRPDWKNYIPLYSADMKSAWEVVEKLKDDFVEIIINSARPQSGYMVFFCNERGDYHARGSTAPLAICRAALLSREE